jgi:hypothetical protein
MKHIGIIVLATLAGCASGPTQEQVQNAYFGRDISAQECTSLAEHFIAGTLIDPTSAQFRNSRCSKGYWDSVPVLGMGVEFGWLQTGEVNGKNSYGGYAGFRTYQVLIRDGAVVRYCISDKNGTCIPSGN